MGMGGSAANGLRVEVCGIPGPRVRGTEVPASFIEHWSQPERTPALISTEPLSD